MLIVQDADFGTDGDSHYRIHASARYLKLISFESNRMMAELGNLLYAMGKGIEAQKYYDFAGSQKLGLDLCQHEYPAKEIPDKWQLYHFIRQIL